MPKVFEYILYKDGKEQYRGFKHNICNKLKCLSIELDEAYMKGYEIDGYKVDRELTDKKLKKKDVVDRVIYVEDKEDKTLAYLINHLNEYGNTCLGQIKEGLVKNYISKLKDRGLDVRYRKVKYDTDVKYWYVLEVKNGRRREKDT